MIFDAVFKHTVEYNVLMKFLEPPYTILPHVFGYFTMRRKSIINEVEIDNIYIGLNIWFWIFCRRYLKQTLLFEYPKVESDIQINSNG